MVTWDKAPEWANYKAIDPNGWVYWFEFKPTLSLHGWQTNGRSRLAGRPNWETSLEKRPSE